MTVTFAPVAVGDFPVSLVFHSDDATQPLATVSIHGIGTLPPNIGITPPAISAQLLRFQSSFNPLTISNTGFSPLVWTATASQTVATNPPWFTLSQPGATTPAGGSTQLGLTIQSGALGAGTYVGSVRIASNDPDHPTITIPVQLVIPVVPNLVATPTSLDFGRLHTGQSKILLVDISDQGTNTVTINGITLTPGAFHVSGGLVTLSPGESVPLLVSYAPFVPGATTATMSVLSDDPLRPVLAIPLSGVAVTPPAVDATPGSFDVQVPAGQRVVRRLTIQNTGGDTAHVTIDAETSLLALAPRPTAPAASKPAPSGTRSGGPSTRGRGGPDRYGHRWWDSDDPNGPTFQWVELAGNGTSIPLNPNKAYYGPFSIGFPFPWFGENQTSFSVSTNGWISFTSTLGYYNGAALPTPLAPFNMLSALWRYPFVAPQFIVYGLDAGRMVIEFIAPSYAFELILEPGGRVVYQYLHTGSAIFVLTGFQNRIGDDGLTIAVDPASLRDGLAIAFQPEPLWLSTLVRAADVPPGASLDVDIPFDATFLEDGINDGELAVRSDDPLRAEIHIPAHLVVSSIPDITAANTLDFGTVALGTSRTDTLWVGNAGTGPLQLSVGPIGGDGFSVLGLPIALTLAPGDSTPIAVRFAPTATCSACGGDMELDSNDPDEDPIDVEFTAVAVSRQSTPPGEPAPIAFGLRNLGRNPSGGELSLELAVPEPARMRVDVFDVRGRAVRSLAAGPLEPGRYALHWDGRDAAGQRTGAGVFFVRAVGGRWSSSLRWVRMP